SDKKNEKGKIILTGSSTPKHKGIMHSGTGRIAKLRMNTMTLYETGDSSGLISITDLIKGKFTPFLFDQVGIDKISYLICRGGWPGNILVKRENASLCSTNYINNIIEEDIAKLGANDDAFYDPNIVKLLLKSLARNEATTASNNKLMSDIYEYDKDTISKNTFVKYLDALKRMFIIDNIEPYSPNVRSSLRVKQMEKHHFSDYSLAAAILNLTPTKMIADINTMGFLFESLVEHDLKIYAEAIGGKLYHYQDYYGNEIDAIIELEDGNWCAFEIKLGLNKAEEGASNLAKVCLNIEKQPLFKCVIYGVGNACYKRSDGIYIIPITALKY
ncbi:MAG: ATP-binding protein, partial [Bacilli bacterium]